MTKDRRIAQCGDCPDLSRRKVVAGAKQLRKALQNGSARSVLLAENADPAITRSILALCDQAGVPVTWVATMAALGCACGIEVGAAAAAIID